MLVSIVIPTYNEAQNMPSLLQRIDSAMKQAELEYECIVVDDDSPDGTAQIAEDLQDKYAVRVFCRKSERGLSSAMLYGLLRSQGDIIGCIDADLQHPPEVIPELVGHIIRGKHMVIGSRLVRGGGVDGWPWYRRLLSWLGRLMVLPLTPVKDTMSGFFFITPQVITGVQLNSIGYKLGLEIMVKGAHRKKIVEVPYIFPHRSVGVSKIGYKVYMAYLWQVFLLYVHRLKLMLV